MEYLKTLWTNYKNTIIVCGVIAVGLFMYMKKK